MNYKVLILTFYFLLNIHGNQNEVTVRNKLTEEPISYVAISFGDNDGIYTNEIGQFNLNLIKSDNIKLSALGYRTRTILIDSINDQVIFLEPESTELQEVLLSEKKKKFKIKKTKPINDKDFLNSYKNSIGNEIACFIENKDPINEVQLKSITIPSYNKTMDFNGPKKQVLKRHSFSTLYKLSFYLNDREFPGAEINIDPVMILFNEKTDKLTIDLESQQIYLPENGCFVSLLNLGPADIDGNFISTSPFYEKEAKNGILKFPKFIKPYFPVNYIKDKQYTFVRYMFGDNISWKTFYLRESKKGEINNISIGYELKVFEN